MNLDEYDNTVFVWVVCCIKNDKVIYFESFNVEHIRKEIKQFTDTRNITANIFRIQGYGSAMSWYLNILILS